MKTLLIVRHAKSSWDNVSMADFDRPLNDRGRRDAPAMARRLLKAGVTIDLFVSSTAKRARTTAELFMHEFEREKSALLLIPELYHAEIPAFREVVTTLDDKIRSAALFSHNPGITAFANSLTSARLDDMPTCGIFAITSTVDHWKDLFNENAAFWFFDYPKSGSDD